MTQSTFPLDDTSTPDDAAKSPPEAAPLADLGREQLTGIIDALPVLVSYVGADGRYRFASRGYEQWYGGSRAELLGKHVREVIGEHAFQEIQHHIEAAVAGQEVTYESLLPLGRESRHVRVSYVPRTGATGATEGFTALVVDVTAQKRVEDSIRFISEAGKILTSSLEYEKTLKTLASLAVPRLADWCMVEVIAGDGSSEQVAVAHTDPAKATYAAEQRRRYPPDPNRAYGLWRVVRTGEPELYEDIPEALLAGTARDEEHLKQLLALGFCSMIIAPLTARGRTLGALTLISAESGRRFGQAELAMAEELAIRAALAIDNARLYAQAQEAVRKRDEFLSLASHELSTPLTTLSLQMGGLIRAAKAGRLEGATADQLLEKLARAEAQVKRLTGLVGELLDVSRIAAGRMDLEPDEVDLTALAREVADRFQDHATAAGCPITVSAEGAVVGRWDRSRLDQVLTNLLANALKYAPCAPVEILLEALPEGGAALHIRDGGPGIATDDQARIFERFERAVPAKRYAGMGLGLWLTRQIVEAHGGQIRLTSRPGEGATFTVELPGEAGAST
jgi:PAS domain S-box-containing protein